MTLLSRITGSPKVTLLDPFFPSTPMCSHNCQIIIHQHHVEVWWTRPALSQHEFAIGKARSWSPGRPFVQSPHPDTSHNEAHWQTSSSIKPYTEPSRTLCFWTFHQWFIASRNSLSWVTAVSYKLFDQWNFNDRENFPWDFNRLNLNGSAPTASSLLSSVDPHDDTRRIAIQTRRIRNDLRIPWSSTPQLDYSSSTALSSLPPGDSWVWPVLISARSRLLKIVNERPWRFTTPRARRNLQVNPSGSFQASKDVPDQSRTRTSRARLPFSKPCQYIEQEVPHRAKILLLLRNDHFTDIENFHCWPILRTANGFWLQLPDGMDPTTSTKTPSSSTISDNHLYYLPHILGSITTTFLSSSSPSKYSPAPLLWVISLKLEPQHSQHIISIVLHRKDQLSMDCLAPSCRDWWSHQD